MSALEFARKFRFENLDWHTTSTKFLVLPAFSLVLLQAQTHPEAAREKMIALDQARFANPRCAQAKSTCVGVAILVGVGRYPPFHGFSNLNYPALDVEELASELAAENYFVVQLIEGNATRISVLETIKQSAEFVKKPGEMIFFFSGHGFQDGKANYLALHDAEADHLARTGLAIEDVIETMKEAGVERRVLWIDACRSAATKGAGERSFGSLTSGTGTHILFSTKSGGVSYEEAALGHGVFTYYLLQGLRGKAPSRDEYLTFRDLADYVHDSVAADSLDRKRAQVPFQAGEYEDDFIIARKKVDMFLQLRGAAPSVKVK